MVCSVVCFFKQKTAYELRISDGSSDVCSSDLEGILRARAALMDRLDDGGHEDLVVHFEADSYNHNASIAENLLFGTPRVPSFASGALARNATVATVLREEGLLEDFVQMGVTIAKTMVEIRSEEHTSELQSLMRISYAVFCLKKKQLQSNTHFTAWR